MQSAQPSHLRRRNSLSSRQTQADLRRQSSSLVVSRSKRLHISHAVQRPGTKEADHRLCTLPFVYSSYGSFQCLSELSLSACSNNMQACLRQHRGKAGWSQWSNTWDHSLCWRPGTCFRTRLSFQREDTAFPRLFH